MAILEQSLCPHCGSEGPHNVVDPEDDGNDADLVLECAECGFEWSPAEGEDDCEHESTFEEQYENAQFAGDEDFGRDCDDNDF